MARPSTPVFSSRLIGRERDLEALNAAVENPGVVLLVGAPGVGKSRLAQELLRSATSRQCVIARLRDAHDRVTALECVGRALGIETSEGLERRIEGALTSGERPLLMIDEPERIEDLEPLVTGWRQAAPGATILVISRHGLLLEGASRHELLPLGLEADGDRATGIEFLAYRASLVGAPVGQDRPSRAAALEIVRALDGVPLAIEVAAAQLCVLGLDELRRRVAPDEAVATPMRDAVQRSVSLLDPREQAALGRLALFADPFDARLGEAVLSDDADALGLIMGLRSKSLLHSVPWPGGERRLFLLRAVRAQMLEQLSDAARLEANARHAEAVATRPGLVSPADVRVAMDHASEVTSDKRELVIAQLLAAAIAWLPRHAAASGDQARIEALRPLLEDPMHLLTLDEALAHTLAWTDREQAIEAFRTLMLASERAGESSRAIRARLDYGRELYRSMRLDEARVACARGLEEARSTSDLQLVVRGACYLAAVYGNVGLAEQAESLLEEASVAAARVGDTERVAQVEAALGTRALDRGALSIARARHQRAEKLAKDASMPRLAMACRGYRGLSELGLGNPEEAAVLLLSAAQQARRLGHNSFAMWLAGAAAARASVGDIDGASELLPEVFAWAYVSVYEEAAYRTVCEVLATRVDVAEAQRALALGEKGRARARALMVRTRIAGARAARMPGPDGDGPRLVDVSDNLRMALALLAEPLESLRGLLSESTEQSLDSTAGGPRLRVDPGGVRFTLGQGEPVSLARRPVLSRLLWALAQRHVTGRPATSEELVAATWPDERLAGRLGKGRLYVALNQLRKLGLRDVIESAPQRGYVLSCELDLG